MSYRGSTVVVCAFRQQLRMLLDHLDKDTLHNKIEILKNLQAADSLSRPPPPFPKENIGLQSDEVLVRLGKKASKACVTAGSITFKHL